VKRKHARIIKGLSAGFFLAFVALEFGACVDDAADCVNTLTCPPPGFCIEAGDARDEVDGCF
jgi:hypothetical protein